VTEDVREAVDLGLRGLHSEQFHAPRLLPAVVRLAVRGFCGMAVAHVSAAIRLTPFGDCRKHTPSWLGPVDMHDEQDSRPTAHRTRIRQLYADRQIIPVRRGFGCSSLLRCSVGGSVQLHTGNWMTVGTEYGSAPVGGVPAKIMIVAMDRGGYGGADEEGFEDAQKQGRTHIARPENPHMGGVLLLLKQLVDDKDPQRLSGMCALTNAVKCVKPTKSMNTDATTTMISECGAHVVAEVDALRPDIIITQGAHPSATITTRIPGLRLISRFLGERGRIAAVFANDDVIVVTTPHPARQKGLKWTKGELPTFMVDAINLGQRELISRLGRRAIGAALP
jgi:hypothetical protein